MAMSLFDDIARGDMVDVVNIPQSLFQQLNDYDYPWDDYRSIRQKCELWFEHFPVQHQSDLRSRFRSTDNRHHGGAFFELFLHELLIRLGCKIQVHPEVGGLTPDFLVNHGDQRFYLEATSPGCIFGAFTLSPNEQDVINKLNKLTSPHFAIRAYMTGEVTRTLGWNRITSGFQALLNDYDPDKVQSLIDEEGLAAAPCHVIESGNWTLTGWLDPIPPEHRSSNRSGKIVHIPMVDAPNPILGVRDAVNAKRKRYRNLDLPFVLAVNVQDPIYVPPDADKHLLWGRHGIWDRPHGSDIAAFWRFQKVNLLNMFRSDTCLYINPQSIAHELPEALRRMPHGRICEGKLKLTAGIDIAETLDVAWKSISQRKKEMAQGLP